MLSCSPEIFDRTLSVLHEGGSNHCETVVLWLGRRTASPQLITEVFRPEQVVDRDFFKIPASGMRHLLHHLRERQLHLLAQVHSHPEEAFHSRADDVWAVVRHVGAVSLVVPWFGMRTGADTFLEDIAAFQLDASDRWLEVEAHSLIRRLPGAS